MPNPGSIEILAYEFTPLGPLCLRRRNLISAPGTVITEITLNHEFLMSSYNTESERALSSRSLELSKGENLSVLVGGLGLGYTAREALLSSRVKNLEVVEYLPQVISWLEEDLIPLSSELKSDQRFKVSTGDIFSRLLTPPQEKFDLILIDIDHSPSEMLDEANQPFYETAGLTHVKEHLNENGILAVWSYDGCEDFEAALRETFASVLIENVSWVNTLVDTQQNDQLFIAIK